MDAQERLLKAASALSIPLSDDQTTRLIAHMDSVLAVNQRMNVTAIADRASALDLHVVDSLAAARWVSDLEGRIADIGTGAGYPGIPIAIALDRPVDLVESVKKKAAFLTEVGHVLGGLHGSRVFAMRAEELALIHPGEYDGVTTRALAALPSLVELASPLLRHYGVLVAMKGDPSEEELRAGVLAADIVGLKEEVRHEYLLPSGQSRVIVRYRKMSEPSVALPRRTGLAQRRPLA